MPIQSVMVPIGIGEEGLRLAAIGIGEELRLEPIWMATLPFPSRLASFPSKEYLFSS